MLGGTVSSMTLADEKQGFSRRLKEAMRRAQIGSRGATHLAREFNLRYHGDPVTAQAVRKWLTGAALPSQDKIRALARWLDVSMHWLRFGDVDRREERAGYALKQDAVGYRADAAWPPKKFDLLSDAHKRLVLEVIHALLRLEGKQ
jgi:transcriptional regulator with XRE-family HTH domain